MSKKMFIFIAVALTIYIVFAGGRFLFYFNRAQNLMREIKAENYKIRGEGPVRKVAVLGDSTTVGIGAGDITKTYHYQFLVRHKDRFSFDVKNYGVSGARTADLASQLSKVDSVDLMLITIGGNDITHGTPWNEVERDLRVALDIAHTKAKTVLILTPGDFRDVFIVPYPIRLWWGSKNQGLSELVSRLAKSTNTIHVDIYALHDRHFHDEPAKYYAPDYFHPSAEGYRLWGEAVETKLKLE